MASSGFLLGWIDALFQSIQARLKPRSQTFKPLLQLLVLRLELLNLRGKAGKLPLQTVKPALNIGGILRET